MAYLEVNKVTVLYKGNKIGIKEASFEANEGDIIGFIGADGTGKSSLMHAIAGVVKFEGEIIFDKYAYHSPKEAEKIKKHMGFMPQGLGLILYNTLTVEEHLNFFASIRNLIMDKNFKAYKQKLLHMAGLSRFTEREAGHLSGGMKQKLSLICALIHKPKLLLLDEPTTGVDPLSRLELWEILDSIRKEEGTIVIVSTAYMQEASKMDKLLLFEDNGIIARGSSKELINTVRGNTYEKTPCESEDCLELYDTTYSLKPLKSKHKEPTLEGLFFVSALKNRKKLPEISVSQRKEPLDIPPIVMEAKQLTKKFGSFVANDRIDIKLKRNEILGLFGANGAGKTTFIKMLLGLYPIDSGELTLLSQPIRSGRDRQKLKSKIGYVSQHFALYKNMSVRENLIYFANIHQIPTHETLKRIERYAEELGFSDYLDAMPKDLPLGINQRFSIAAAIIHEPVVLFLDEPTSGVDVIARYQLWQLLRLLKEKWGISILITTHYMSEAEYCDRVVLLKDGKKVADDTVENFYKKHPNANNFEEIFLEYYKEAN
ncbi:MAG: ABC transporter ATP-binding protein [Deltaproteobacteria bacterium]|nr:ABC transporter ATP-binding protein [Deltaproteobacteria bacterium]